MHINKRVILAAGVFLLGACGSEAESLKETPLNELVQAAAEGDSAAMQELERRGETAAKVQADKANAGDAETTFQTALYSGDPTQVDALADAGNAFALTYLASMIGAQTDASEEDKAKARTMLETAADAGHAQALFRMSEDYLAPSQLYPMDEAKALELGIRAAEAGDPEGMYKTGIRYQYGLATAEQDNAKAKEWLEKAKAANYPDAQRQLDELAEEE